MCGVSLTHAGKSNNAKIKQVKHDKSELGFISSGDIKQIEDWAAKVIKTNNYAKYIRAKFVSDQAKNIADIMKFFPSVDTTLSNQHVFRENGRYTNRPYDMTWHNKDILINLLQIKNSVITEVAASGLTMKANLEEYWLEWSKFCLEDVIFNLIDWIAQKSTVNMKQRIVNSRKSIVNKIQARIQTGIMNVSDLYSAQSELATAETELFIAKNKERVLRNKLDDISGGIEPPQHIGEIPSCGDWEENKMRILRGSHDLQTRYYKRKAKMASNSSNMLNVLPSVGVGVRFDKRDNRPQYRAKQPRKWRGSFELSMNHHFGLDTLPKVIQGSAGVKAARLEYLEAVRNTITAGHEIFADLQNGMQELKMHKKALDIHEKSLRVKRELFFSDLELQGKRRISIDDVIYAEGNVTYAHTKTIEAYQKAAKNHFKLMHMIGDLANKIGNRKYVNHGFESSVEMLQKNKSADVSQ